VTPSSGSVAPVADGLAREVIGMEQDAKGDLLSLMNPTLNQGANNMGTSVLHGLRPGDDAIRHPIKQNLLVLTDRQDRDLTLARTLPPVNGAPSQSNRGVSPMYSEHLLKQIDDACVELPGVQQGQCPLCERVGLPILPVRYSVCQRSLETRGFAELPTNRVVEFTDIRLDQSVSDQGPSARTLGSHVRDYLGDATDSQVSKYILRQLRPGYFYLLDDENDRNIHDGTTSGDRINHNWYAYVVTTDGMFYQYSISETPPSPEQPEFTCGLNDDDRRTRIVSASVIALDSVDTAKNIYYLYTEHPLSSDFLNHLRTGRYSDGRRMRDVAMQCFDVEQWRNNTGEIQQPYAFTSEELHHVAEYSDNAEGMEAFFWPDQSNRQLFTRKELRQALSHRLRAASSQLQDKSLVLAVHDEVGLINELNAYRQAPLELLEEFLHQYDDQGYPNRRNLLCYKAIDIFEKNYRVQRKIAQEPTNRRIEKTSEPKITKLQGQIDQLNRQIEEIRSDGDISWLDKTRIDRLRNERSDLQDQIDCLKEDNEDSTEEPWRLINAYNKELADCYALPDAAVDPETSKRINPDLEDFKVRYERLIAKINKLVRAYDEDYSLWVEAHLDRVTLRYSDDTYSPGLRMSGMLSNALLGGILSDASKRLWERLAGNLDSPQSTLMKIMFSNQRRLVDEAITIRHSLPAHIFVSPRVLLHWREQYRTLLHEEREFQYDTTMAAVISTIGNSLYSLTVYDMERALHDAARSAASEPPSNVQAISNGSGQEQHFDLASSPSFRALDSFNRYQQLIITGSHDVQQVQASQDSSDSSQFRLLPVLASVTVGRKDFHDWLDELTRQLYPRGKANPNTPSPEAMKFYQDNGVGGNFSVSHIENDYQITVVIPVNTSDPDFLERYNTTTDDYNEDDITTNGWNDRQNARDLGSYIAEGIRVGAPSSHAGLARGAAGLNRALVFYNNIGILSKEFSSDSPDAIQITTAMAKLGLVAIDGVEFTTTFMASSNGMLASLARYLRYARGPLDAAIGTLSIMDGLNKLDNANRARKLGMPESTQNKHKYAGSIDITSGIVALSIVAIGVIYGAPVLGVTAALAIGNGLITAALKLFLGSSLTILVAPAVASWVNRCRYGNHQGQLLPYEALEEEKNGLELLFKGVTVEMTWEKYDEAFESRGPVPLDGRWEDIATIATNDIKINILVTAPDLEGIELGLKLEIGEKKNDQNEILVNENYIKTRESDTLTRRNRSASQIEESPLAIISKHNGLHTIAIEKFTRKNNPPIPLTLYIDFCNSETPRDTKTGSFTMEF